MANVLSLSRAVASFIIVFGLASLLSSCQLEKHENTAPSNHKQQTEILAICPATPAPVIIEKPCDCQCDQKQATTKPKTNTDSNKTDEDYLKQLKPSPWESIGALKQQDLLAAWPAWLQSCRKLKQKVAWQSVCKQAQQLNQDTNQPLDNAAIQSFFTNEFNLYQVHNANGTTSGTVTGYYQPVLKGSRTATANAHYPLYNTPDSLITVALADQFPSLKHKRVRGMVDHGVLRPYYTRGQIDIEDASSPIAPYAFLYLQDKIEGFFLHVQGSGVIELPSGELVQVGYDNHNGHPYHSIGRALIRRGALKASQASMQGIKRWAKQHPDQLQSLLNVNTSYVFFKELPSDLPGPLGALGVPLIAEQAIAVDKRYIPLGAPVFLSTTYPNSKKPLKKLMMAQDTGGAIKGAVRADFYWGTGKKAGSIAGAMKQQGKMWVLLPKALKIK